jgi:hypothetical protein
MNRLTEHNHEHKPVISVASDLCDSQVRQMIDRWLIYAFGAAPRFMRAYLVWVARIVEPRSEALPVRKQKPLCAFGMFIILAVPYVGAAKNRRFSFL